MREIMLMLFAVFLFSMGCSAPSYTSDGGAIQEVDLAQSRQIAEDFVRSHSGFLANGGQNLNLIAEEPLRCRLCWVFDFRYVVLVNGKPYDKYVTVTVQEGKASMAIPAREGMPPGQ
jgi:hypothetical protein